MQGNKKGTDGFSDSSSIGSLLDDADREVSSLTERAFRSLCISEDTSFSESPDLTRQVLGSLHQGTVSHTQRKSGIWSQLPSQGTEHTGWAATFQQLPKYVQGEEKYPKGSPPPTPAQRRLEVPVSGLRSSNKPLSKVSSLIKSFDRPDSQRGDSRPPPSKPPVLKTAPKFAPLPESGVNFCFDSAFLTVRRVPAEVSSTHHSGHQPVSKHGEQESPKNLETASHCSSNFLSASNDASSSFESKFHSPAHKSARGEPGRGKEWAPKGTFLHSENSAFESWSTHQPRLLKRKDPTEGVPESKGPKHCQDTPLLRESHPLEHKASPSHAQADCSQEESRLPTGALSTSRPWCSRDPGAQVFTMEGKSSGFQPDPQEKPTQAPWRKPKTGKGRKESLQNASEEKKQPHRRDPPLYAKQTPQGQFPEDEAPDMPVDSRQHYTPPFNISKLLTPVIPTKHVLDSLSNQPAERTPSPPGQPNGYQEKEPGDDQSRDSYKSKAPSLLFNLKDVRKRVKSTYSPNLLLKGIDEKARDKADGKQETVSNGVTLPNGLEDSPASQLSKERTSDILTASCVSTQKDPRADPSGSSADNYLTLSSPPTTAKASFCVNGEAAETGSYEKDDVHREAKLSPTRPGWGSDSGQHGLRKHLSLKICRQEPEAAKTAETLQTHQMQNGISRSVSQDTEPKREAGLLNPSSHQKPSPGPLSPEEEDVFYSDSQSDFMPGLQSKAKFSTSSSDQSFASFEDQQKTWCVESRQEDRKSDMHASDSQRYEKERVMLKDGQQLCALSNGRVCMDESTKGESLQRDGESLSGGRPRRSTEGANFTGSWVGGNKDTALSHAKDLTAAPSSTSNKHILFTIKDNTLRATPVIKPILLPLLRTVSSEDSPAGGHREAESPRPGEDAGAPEGQGIHGTPAPAHPLPTDPQDTHQRPSAHQGPEDHQQAPVMAKTEAFQPAMKGAIPSPPLVGEGEGMSPLPGVAPEVMGSNGRRGSTDQVRLDAPRCVPKITFLKDNTEDGPPPHLLGRCGEEQTQGFRSNFLSTPRAGAPGRRQVPGEVETLPNRGSLEAGSVCSPTTSSVWDEASQAPSELGLPLQEEPPSASPWASLGPAPVTRREDLTHALFWEEGSDAQPEPSAEDLRPLSPKGSLLAVAASSAGLPERLELPVQPERPVGKPPAVPPKTEKALRRAKKLASKRRKTDQGQGRPGEPREERPWPEDSKRAERRPPSPKEMPQKPSFPSVRSLPPPVHRHSVSSFSEHSRRQARVPQSAKPLPPYPVTQKVLQDPQSGEYFVFDLPLQVKIKTFYDPETGQYFKVPVPSSARGSPESSPADAPVDPLLLFSGFQRLTVTALTPLRCSSQLSTPTFLWPSPSATTEGAAVGHQGPCETGLQRAPRAFRNSTQNAPSQCPKGPPHSPKEEGRDAPSLEIITINDLEDFATEGIS
ncbi:cardiac-enriched FHL2-interacting protein [Elephas maximus indicus]|uniref:cardiac-enriched FHL2-interacting protein n=1 Tax=Elephas maximus indicus TaxID=99487 RepID=UPI002115FF55|nr:cardiac-enriched FHL2-interacting protein [Elephas maximus indicus]XP_049711806.1 cardiac-enriched FHL2-interacting protein [Elephas maximus indicus]